MDREFLVGSVVGEADAARWAQVLVTPVVYVVLEVVSVQGQASQHGVRLLRDLVGMAADPHEFSVQIINWYGKQTDIKSLVVLLLQESEAGLWLFGSGGIFLRRGNQFATLLQGPGTLAGSVQPGDTFILASAAFLATVSLSEMVAAFDHRTACEVAEFLTIDLTKRQQMQKGAALVIQMPIVASTKDDTKIATMPIVSSLPGFGLRQKASVLWQNLKDRPRQSLWVFLFIFFVLSVFAGVYRQLTNVQAQRLQDGIKEVAQLTDEGSALLELNTVKAEERLSEAEALLGKLQTEVVAGSREDRELAILKKRLDSHLLLSRRDFSVVPEIFFDPGVLKKEAKVSTFALYDQTLVLADPQTRTVYSLDTGNKKSAIVGGGAGFDNLSSLDLHGGLVYVLTASGVQLIDLSSKKTYQQIVKPDEKWGNVNRLFVYGGNIYLLDTGVGRIWKYTRQDEKESFPPQYSDLGEYLSSDVLVDVSQVTSWAIDGFIWMGTVEGQILSLAQGRPRTFTVTGVGSPFSSRLSVYTNDALDEIYILEAAKKRVVALDKDGIYKAQYHWEADLVLTDLVVSQVDKKIFLLGGGLIYAFALPK